MKLSAPSRTAVLALLAGVCLATGCSGGGTSPAPLGAKGGSTQPSSAKKQIVSITFVTGEEKAAAARNSGAKHVEYVSPATLGAVVIATSTDRPENDARLGYDLSSSSSNCVSNPQGGALDCALTIPLAVDTYQIELDTYDANDAGLPAALGTELSTQAQSVTVTAGSTAMGVAFDPHAFVAGFCFQPGQLGVFNDGGGPFAGGCAIQAVTQRSAHRRSESGTRPQALESPAAAFVFGGLGGASEQVGVVAAPLDRDGSLLYLYPGVTTFTNGVFTLNVAEPADETGCTAIAPCTSVSNSNGTSFAPYATPTARATISMPDGSEQLMVSYSGGGGPGAGVTSWTLAEGAPTGTRPFYTKISIPDPSRGTISPYVVPSVYALPLFVYATDGLGHAASTTSSNGGTLYVWAAQATMSSTYPEAGPLYLATFNLQTESTTCQDSDSNTVMTVENATYYLGYGAVFPVSVTPHGATSCVLYLADDFDDTALVTLTAPAAAAPAERPWRVGEPSTVRLCNVRSVFVLGLSLLAGACSSGGSSPGAMPVPTPTPTPTPTPVPTQSVPGTISVPCIQQTFPPEGSSSRRRPAATDQGDPPTLVQYAGGVSSATLPNPVAAGDTLVVIVGDNFNSPKLSNSPIAYSPFANASFASGNVYTADVSSTQNIGPLASGDNCNTAMWIGEFAGSSSSAIQAANAASFYGTTTGPIAPNAKNGLVITSYVALDVAAAAASTGYTEYFALGPKISLDVQLANSPTTDTTDPVSNTFNVPSYYPEGVAGIFQIPPSSFASAGTIHRTSLRSKPHG